VVDELVHLLGEEARTAHNAGGSNEHWLLARPTVYADGDLEQWETGLVDVDVEILINSIT
jgi:hypothetical protein